MAECKFQTLEDMMKHITTHMSTHKCVDIVFNDGVECGFQRMDIYCLPGIMTVIVNSIVPPDEEPEYNWNEILEPIEEMVTRSVLHHRDTVFSDVEYERNIQIHHLTKRREWVMVRFDKLKQLATEAKGIPAGYCRIVQTMEIDK